MFPEHCKHVSVRTADFPLTEENIKRYLEGKRAYLRSKYFVFNNGADWAVASVAKEEKNSVLQPILGVDIVALPHETKFVEDPSLEVLSASVMGALRESVGAKCVVVKGRSEHVSFFVEMEPHRLTVFDVVPPSPSKLVGLVDSVLETDLQDMYVKYETRTVDLNDMVDDDAEKQMMFPCRASGLGGNRSTLYLDETVPLKKEQLDKVVLIGCDLSVRIFKAIYGFEPREVRNMCPWQIAMEQGMGGKVLVKCCKVKEGVEMDGDVAVVPWGARASDVAAALKALFL